MVECARCRRKIEGRCTTALGKNWHLDCFRCAACAQPLAEQFMERDGQPYHEACFHQRFSPRCAGCHKPITGHYTTALGESWHPDHFVCAQCRKPFAGKSFYEREHKAYCENCFHGRFSPRCQICGATMRDRFLENYWGERFCAWHEQEMEHCEGCSRLIAEKLTGGA